LQVKIQSKLVAMLFVTSAVVSAVLEDVPSSVELRWRPGEHQAALT